MRYLLLLLLCTSAIGADKSVFISSNVAAGANANNDAAPVPLGKKLLIKRVGLTDVSMTQSPSIVRLIWNGNVIREFSATGQTVEIPGNGVPLVGNGTKFLRVQRSNPEAVAKVISVWIDASDSDVKN